MFVLVPSKIILCLTLLETLIFQGLSSVGVGDISAVVSKVFSVCAKHPTYTHFYLHTFATPCGPSKPWEVTLEHMWEGGRNPIFWVNVW